MKHIEQYDNCISLGCFCGTASSLSNLGLRSFSAPFDWCWSNFSSVMNQIDNEFTDFMKKENLKIIKDNPKCFIDKKYKFYYNHDIKENFEIEYADIYAKYIRRAKRFIENIKKPTCFFRAVRSEKEIKYIINNADYIESVLKRFNSRNSIVYILLKNMNALPNNFRWFRLTVDRYIGKVYEMRMMFYQSKELLLFCKTLLKIEQINLNKKYDVQKNGQKAGAGEVKYYVQNDIDGIEKKILNILKLQDNESFYLWGGGTYGISLYQYLIKRGVKVKAIIDNRARNEFPDDIVVISPNDVEYCSKILITIKDEKSNDEIKEQIKEKKCEIFTFKEIIVGSLILF